MVAMCMNRHIYEKVSMPFVPLQFQKTNVMLTEKPLKKLCHVMPQSLIERALTLTLTLLCFELNKRKMFPFTTFSFFLNISNSELNMRLNPGKVPLVQRFGIMYLRSVAGSLFRLG